MLGARRPLSADVAMGENGTASRASGRARRCRGSACSLVRRSAPALLAYVFLVLAARALTPEGYGQVGVLWGALYLAVVVMFRPLEQTTTRTIADRLARRERGSDGAALGHRHLCDRCL